MHMPPPVHGASMVGKYIKESECVNSAFECTFINPTTARNLEDVNKFRWKKVMDVVRLIGHIKDKIHEFQPDIVYFTANATGIPFYKDWLIVKAIKTSLLKEAHRRPDGKVGQIVVHYHNKGVCTRQNKLVDNLLYRSFYKDIKVILLAESLYKDVEKYVKREDVMICPNGIPDLYHGKERIFTNPARTNSIPDKDITHTHTPYTITILYLSNIMEEKGVWTLLDACRILKEQDVQFHCDFVGGWKDITLETFGARVDSLGLMGSVTAHGPKYGAEKLPFLKEADVMVFPTYYHNECFPLVLLEGMMHELPCISTDEGGIPAIIEDGKTGYIVKAKDSQLLASKIENLANDRPKCLNMGVAGRERFLNNFTQEIFENRITEILKQLV